MKNTELYNTLYSISKEEPKLKATASAYVTQRAVVEFVFYQQPKDTPVPKQLKGAIWNNCITKNEIPQRSITQMGKVRVSKLNVTDTQLYASLFYCSFRDVIIEVYSQYDF